MNLEARSPEWFAVQRLEADLRRNISGAWICIILAAVFAALAWDVYLTPSTQRGADWMLVITFGVVVVILSGVSVITRYFVSRDRKRLAQLKAVASAMLSGEQPEVWPPPPRATD